jgi:hypothetical protein
VDAIVMLVDPSKDTPAIVRGFFKVVVVSALPVRFPVTFPIKLPVILAVPIELTITSGAFNVNVLLVASQENKAFGVDVPLSKDRAAFSVSAVALSELIIQLSDDVLPVAIVP